MSTAVDIAAGGMHTVVLNSDGEVFTFGCNDEGRIKKPAHNSLASRNLEKCEKDIERAQSKIDSHKSLHNLFYILN